MRAPITIVDAFTREAFGGNPAAVCILEREAPAAWMQSVAGEMNLSETAFLSPHADGFGLRWFTPTVEVDLCGHATLASAHVLWETARLRKCELAKFHTKCGFLLAVFQGDAIELDFPSQPPRESPPPPDLLAALGVEATYVGKNAMDYLVVVRSEAIVRGSTPDMARLAKLPARGVILSAQSDARDYDFVSRFFAPAAGVPEDPVTGSAHCCLAPYWSERLGKAELVGFQASRRTGIVRVRCAGDRVILGGHAVTVLRGEIEA